MLSRKMYTLIAALSIIAITQAGCKKDENKSPEQKKQEVPPPPGSGSSGGGAPASGAPATPTQKQTEESKTKKSIELAEIPTGYYEITGIRYFPTKNPKTGFAIKVLDAGKIYKGDPVQISKEGEGNVAAQIPFFIEANDDTIAFHDFILFASSFKGGRSPEWHWNTLVGTLTANQIITGFKDLGLSWEYEGKFKTHKITITDTTLTITAESPDTTLEAQYRLKAELKDRPEAMATYNKKDKTMEVSSVFRGLYMPIFKHASSKKEDFSGYPSAFLQTLKEKEYKDKYMHTLRKYGMWIKGSIATSTYSDGRTQTYNTLTWTTELMKWNQKNSPKRKDQILSALYDYKAYVEIAKQAEARDSAGRPNLNELNNGYLAMIKEAISAIEEDRHPGKPGPWDLLN